MLRVLLVLLLLPVTAPADDWAALDDPRAVALLRHALAPGTGDPASFRLDDCTTQRNLDDRGRAQARAIGNEIRARGIDFDAVFTSQWCRTRDTARLLGLGPVIEAPELNSFFSDRGTAADQTAATRTLISNTPGRLMLVTHQVNITALTGLGVGSGEIVVVRPEADGVKLMGRIGIGP